MKLYLAYGANTNFSSMDLRCPAAKYVCNLDLKDHQLVFRGVADVVPLKGKKVECALWTITEECERSLDTFEGFPTFYVKKYVRVWLKGRWVRIMFYLMRKQERRAQSPAYSGYEQTLRQGYADCGMSVAQIDDALKRAIASNFVSVQRKAPMRQKGNPRIAPQLPLPYMPNYRRAEGLFKATNAPPKEPPSDETSDKYYENMFTRFYR